jgi:hypothetical protein
LHIVRDPLVAVPCWFTAAAIAAAICDIWPIVAPISLIAATASTVAVCMLACWRCAR